MTGMRNVFVPSSLEEIFELLEREPAAMPYAGGTDLLVRLRTGLVSPPALICIDRIPELQQTILSDGRLFIGAGTTHRELMDHPFVREHVPILCRAAAVIGSPPIRNMGTLGGNIVTASPAGDTLPGLFVLNAEVELRSRNATRRMPINQFILGPGMVDLRKGELLTRVVIGIDPKWPIQHYEKVGRRKALACCVASLAAVLNLEPDGTVQRIRIALGAVGPTVVQCPEAEAFLIGKPLSLDTLRRAAGIVRKAVNPIDDVRASAAYRREVAGNLLLRLMDYAAT
jgi:CO/xanthine dehydrogenase FAD-binding subunit